MKRTPLKKVSDKKREADAEFRKASKEVIFRSYGRCEANTPACPEREHAGAHRHHIGRRRGVNGGHTADNLLNVCFDAHRFIHENPLISYEKGWLRRSWE